MIELILAPHTEALANPDAADYARIKVALNSSEATQLREPLYHQLRTYQALQRSEIVINSYNTGTGKTQAALLHLLHLKERYLAERDESRAGVLFIAPTNELLRQHARDVEQFVEHNSMPHRVVRLDADTIRTLSAKYLPPKHTRQGDRLHQLLDNWRRVMEELTGEEIIGHAPLIVITNPDIFYYALYGLGNPHDRNVLFRDFVETFNYIIVDEFHYYNAKQLANFLFFFTLLREWGYFEEASRRVCLLTATPNAEVEGYLRRLEQGARALKIQQVRPGDERPDLRRIPALAPVRLRLYSAEELNDGLIDLAVSKEETIFEWVAAGRHGAIISSALWRINRIYKQYRRAATFRLGRLTGPEREQGRQAACDADLMLATPTVDIGYNFDRKQKRSQSIDFLLYDARHSDEFVQRLGRAGRVLGKPETDTPSDIWAVIPDELVAALRDRDGQEITRGELLAVVRQVLAPRNGIYSYVRSGAIAEAFMPIYNVKASLSTAEARLAEELFEAVKQVYDATSSRTFNSLAAEIKYYRRLSEAIPGALRDARARSFQLGADSIRVRRLVEANKAEESGDDPYAPLGDVEEYARQAEAQLRNPRNNCQRNRFAQDRVDDIERYHVLKTRFNFRDSFQAPQAIVHDPGCLLSGEEYNVYSAVHIAENYQARWSADPRTVAQWASSLKWQLDEDLSLCCTIVAERDERLSLAFLLDNPRHSKQEWENRYLRRLSATDGFSLVPAYEGGGKVSGELNDIFEQTYFAFYAVPAVGKEARALLGLKKTTNLFVHGLRVAFGEEDGGDGEYLVVLGTAALMIEQEKPMVAARYAAQKADKEAIFC